MPLDLSQADYEELRRQYLHASARRGLRTVLKPTTRQGLGRLLGHHSERPISDAQTWLRDEVDYLLHYYSALEVACLAGVLTTATLTASDRNNAMQVLDEPSVRKYYEKHYPILLPQLFRARLLNRWAEVTHDPRGPSLAHELYRISAPIDNDTALETFLWFLDGGSRWDASEDDWIDIDDTIGCLREDNSLGKRLGRRPKGPLDKSVQGFQQFLEFCVRFDALLVDAAALPLLRDAMWEFNSYWFRQLGRRIDRQVLAAVADLIERASLVQFSPSRDNVVLQLPQVQREDLVRCTIDEGKNIQLAVRRLLRSAGAFDVDEVVYGTSLLAAALRAGVDVSPGKWA